MGCPSAEPGSANADPSPARRGIIQLYEFADQPPPPREPGVNASRETFKRPRHGSAALWIAGAAAGILVLAGAPARADMALLLNASDRKIDFLLTTPEGRRRAALEPKEMLPVPLPSPTGVDWPAPQGRVRKRLENGAVYQFRLEGDHVVFREVPLRMPAGPTAEIPVKILVDDEEESDTASWQSRLKARVAAASDLFDSRFGIRFTVVDAGVWESDDQVSDVPRLLLDFRRKNPARPGGPRGDDPNAPRIMIGFTSQPIETREKIHLGGIPGPLATHILLRERPVLSEPERVEILVHELGHFLGAPHSEDPHSAMRPVLGDGQAKAPGFQMGFDPLSVMAMNVVAHEIKNRKVLRLQDMSASSRSAMIEAYTEFGRLYPRDPLSRQYLAVLGTVTRVGGRSAAPPASFNDTVRQVLAAVVDVARKNAALPDASRIRGDELTRSYVRAASDRAAKMPAPYRAQAFLVGLAVAMDRSEHLREFSLTRGLWKSVEPDAKRTGRLAVLGEPTMRDRYDMVQHFFVSGGLFALFGVKVAESAGVQKELRDAEPGGSGFSMADMLGNLAGISFAERIFASPDWPEKILDAFRPDEFLPPLEGLPEGMDKDAFAARYGSTKDPRYLEAIEDLRRRVARAPGLRALSGETPVAAGDSSR